MNKQFKLILEHDDCVESPCEWGTWTVAGFNRRYINFVDPSTYLDDSGRLNIGLRRQLACGTAFFLSYFEHGLCRWSLQAEGPQCQWDTSQFAGIIFLENPKYIRKRGDQEATYKLRQEAARAFLDIYTEWCNGSTYMFRLVNVSTSPWDHGDEEEAWCAGLVGSDDLASAIQDELGENGVVVVTEGGMSDTAQYLDIPQADRAAA